MSDSLPQPGDTVRVVSGPLLGETGTVRRVAEMSSDGSTAVMVLINFSDGSWGYQGAASLEKMEAAESDGGK